MFAAGTSCATASSEGERGKRLASERGRRKGALPGAAKLSSKRKRGRTTSSVGENTDLRALPRDGVFHY